MTKLIFCNKEYRAQDSFIAPHCHNCSEIVFYGNTAHGETDIDGIKYELPPMGIALIRRGIFHSEKHLEGANVIFLGFESSVPLPAGVWEDMAHVKPLLYQIAEEVRNQEWGYDRIISLKIQEILAYIERRKSGAGRNVKDLAYCKRYIEENYMRNVSVSELAEMTCYSRDRFRHLFAEEFGIFPQNYLISVRLENAGRLLRTTKLGCADIAQMCGFSDSGQMAKMIRKKYGTSPKELRTAQKEEPASSFAEIAFKSSTFDSMTFSPSNAN